MEERRRIIQNQWLMILFTLTIAMSCFPIGFFFLRLYLAFPMLFMGFWLGLFVVYGSLRIFIARKDRRS